LHYYTASLSTVNNFDDASRDKWSAQTHCDWMLSNMAQMLYVWTVPWGIAVLQLHMCNSPLWGILN